MYSIAVHGVEVVGAVAAVAAVAAAAADVAVAVDVGVGVGFMSNEHVHLFESPAMMDCVELNAITDGRG